MSNPPVTERQLVRLQLLALSVEELPSFSDADFWEDAGVWLNGTVLKTVTP